MIIFTLCKQSHVTLCHNRADKLANEGVGLKGRGWEERGQVDKENTQIQLVTEITW